MATRWAICGTGKIAGDFCRGLKLLPSTEHQIVAVAARQKESAEKFAAEFDIPQSYGSYEDLARVQDIDVVYIATLHINHVKNSLLYINAGKNVLCEKPMAMTLAGCKKVLSAAKEKGVLFVEAFWTRFFPAYKFITEHIKSGAIGEVNMVEASFHANIAHVPRLHDPDLGGGGLLDIGCYTVQAANFLFKGRPEKIEADVVKAETGVDKTAVIHLRYPGDKYASLTYSIVSAHGANSFTIRGAKGNIVIPDHFWCPTRLVLQNNEVKYFELPEAGDKAPNFPNYQGLSYEAQGVRDALLKGQKESPHITHDDSESIMYIIDHVLTKAGVTVKFP